MEKNRKQLTEQQRNLVENNHNLIYKFANDKKLPIDEYYGILAISLCKAAINYDKDKGCFSTIAYLYMNNELCDYYKNIYRKTAIPDNMIYSYDVAYHNKNNEYNLYKDNEYNLLDLIPDKQLTNEAMIDKIMLKSIVENLDEKEKEIIMLLYAGVSKLDISRNVPCSKYKINTCLEKVRKKYYDN